MVTIIISCYCFPGISVPNFMSTFCYFGHPRDSSLTTRVTFFSPPRWGFKSPDQPRWMATPSRPSVTH